MKRLIAILSILLPFILIVMGACNQMPETTIKVDASISKLSENEYKRVGTPNLDNPVPEDFKKFTFHFKMEHSDEITSREIDMPDLKSFIDSIDEKRYWYGNGDEQDDKNENFARYTKEFVFYSKGLSDEELKTAFDSAIISVSWDSKDGNAVTKEYLIGDLIEFKE